MRSRRAVLFAMGSDLSKPNQEQRAKDVNRGPTRLENRHVRKDLGTRPMQQRVSPW